MLKDCRVAKQETPNNYCQLGKMGIVGDQERVKLIAVNTNLPWP